MSQDRSSPEQHTVLADAWGHVVGGMEWLQSVLFGEFADHRPLSAVVADMLVSFIPGVVIVTSARDAVAVIFALGDPSRKARRTHGVGAPVCVFDRHCPTDRDGCG